MADYKLVYNPKEFDGKPSAKVVDMFAIREGNRPQGKILEKPAVYTIGINEIKKFRVDVADYLLGKYGFLEEVQPKDVDSVLKKMKEKRHKCPLCDFKTDTPIALKGHMRSHKLSEEAQKVLDEIPTASPDAYVVGAAESRSGQTEFIRAEEAEGIPATKTDDPRDTGPQDRDNVEWYGTGVQASRRKGGQSPSTRGGTPGMAPVRRPATNL